MTRQGTPRTTAKRLQVYPSTLPGVVNARCKPSRKFFSFAKEAGWSRDHPGRCVLQDGKRRWLARRGRSLPAGREFRRTVPDAKWKPSRSTLGTRHPTRVVTSLGRSLSVVKCGSQTGFSRLRAGSRSGKATYVLVHKLDPGNRPVQKPQSVAAPTGSQRGRDESPNPTFPTASS